MLSGGTILRMTQRVTSAFVVATVARPWRHTVYRLVTVATDRGKLLVFRLTRPIEQEQLLT